jgi:16S rRNA processing protein RimM
VTPAQPDLIVVGRVGATLGIRGEVFCMPTRIGDDMLATGREVVVQPAVGAPRAGRIANARRHRGRLLIILEGTDTQQAAHALHDATLAVPRDQVPLQRDEYLDDDLIGLSLCDEAGRTLGTVNAVRHYPAQDCLVVTPGDALVPLVKEFVRAIELDAKRIVVALPPGLLDERAEEA